MSMEERPMAPSRMALATSFFMASISAGVTGLKLSPLTKVQTCPSPTKEQMLVATPFLSM